MSALFGNRVKKYDYLLMIIAVIFLSLSSLSINQASADDTEIFLGNGDVADGVQPNVLFILDNSGSMGARLSDGTNRTRMEAMKESFSQLISTSRNVNIGVMRFNTPGGSIAYPVTDVDQPLEIPYMDNTRMVNSDDDAFEAVSDGQVNLTSETIVLGRGEAPSSAVTVRVPIQHEDDDAEERVSNGSLTVGHSQFDMDASQVNGLRFYGLGIPVGATIVEAKIRFTSITNYTSDAVIKIEGEAAPNPDRFDMGSVNDVTSRTRTTEFINWEVTTDWFRNREYYTPNLAAIVQEQIDHPDWASDNALVFIFDHQSASYRSGYLYRDDRGYTQGLSGRASVIEVTYTTGDGGEDSFIAGLRFQDVGIPQGATVTSAMIGFTAAETDASAATFQVRVENSNDADPFEDSDEDLSNPVSRPKYGSVVNWEVDGTWTADQVEPGPDVTSLVQAVVNRSGWCGNNSMAFYFSSTDPVTRKIYTVDAGFDRQPTLTVSYTYDEDTAPEGSGCINPIFASYLGESSHDGYQQDRGSRRVNNDGSYLRIGNRYMSGVRYENLPIRQGATIRNAYLVVTAHPNDANNPVTITIKGHDHDNAPAIPEQRRNLSDRLTTTASADWATGVWTEDLQYESPDIKRVIQEIVNRPNWEAGNSLALLLTSSSNNERRIYDWDGGTAKAVKLVIEVESGGIDQGSNTVRQHIAALVESLEARTWTPIVDSLYEAALYYRGDSMFYGKHREMFTQIQGFTDERYKRVSVPASYSGGTHVLPAGCPSSDSNSSRCDGEEVTGNPVYISPINSACQSNHIVLLTDGHANNNHNQTKDGINAMISGFTGRDCRSDSASSSQECSRDLVRYLANVDQRPSIAGYDNVINTHTIAFNLDSDSARSYLSELATIGGGLYKQADTAAELAEAFDEILRSVLSINTTFVSPGATINQFNRLTHRNEIYFSLFKPDSNAKWAGNIKRYKLLGDPPVISDVNDESAVDLTTGFFKEGAKSVWSETVDGSEVELGGSAYEIPDLNDRNVYTYLSDIDEPQKSLTHSSNKLHEDNDLITEAMLGVDNEATRNNVLKWSRGMDLKDWDNDTETDEMRYQYGDPLHSVPALVTYGGTEESPNIAIFVGTNEGFLHAINTENGQEYFSFIPEDLLSNLPTFYEDAAGFSHPYGLDGSPVVWVNDTDFDGQVESNDGDFVYLYVGMRRGGKNMYALDVTSLSVPKVLWTIEGGSGDFALLGQTWSKPVKTRIKIGSTVKDVLIFSGGYDPNQDLTTVKTPDAIGRAIYIVDAKTGQRLWVGYDGATVLEGESFPDMDYSIPGDIAIIDINQDGMAEQFYVADVGGQVWRFDINNGESISSLISGGVIGSFAGATPESARRFFNKPNVSLLSKAGVQKLAISIGSGSRFNPLNKVMVDRFYTFYQSSVFNAPDSYDEITELDLVDRTNLSDNADIESGWYITMTNPGEKVLASSVTVNNTVFFNTYTPDAAANSCQAVVGQGRTYAVSIFNANAAFDLDDDDNLEPISDRVRTLHSGAIPPAPKMLISEEGILTLLVGPEQPYNDQMLGAVRTDRWFNSYWYERDSE